MRRRPTKENNFIWLLVSLVFLMFSSAMFSQLNLDFLKDLINMTLMITMIVSVWSLQLHSEKWFRTKLSLSVGVVLLMLFDRFLEYQLLGVAQLFLIFLFLAFTIHVAWKHVLFTGEITANKIVGAICIYILLGLVFAIAFLLVEHFSPGSLQGLESSVWQENLETVIYYSMVTLTTVGYGDITPAAPITMFLAYMEAVIGIMYTTVLIASLIGMRFSSFHDDSKT